MKLNIVKDKAGKAIATYETAQGNGPSVTPELDHSYTVHEVEVAENYIHNIEAVYKQHGK
ncbi:MAG TPA: hypothetical protein VG096_06345 [Bryobacteraceae bacterium]|jgi:hypothetical protein|nr:hypothetical protein [Bryobacteraceae bacterium]